MKLHRIAASVAADDGVRIENSPANAFTDSVPISESMQGLVAEAAETVRTGVAAYPQRSGATTTQAIATINRRGDAFRSQRQRHQPTPLRSFTTPEDCANGAQVLLNVSAHGR